MAEQCSGMTRGTKGVKTKRNKKGTYGNPACSNTASTDEAVFCSNCSTILSKSPIVVTVFFEVMVLLLRLLDTVLASLSKLLSLSVDAALVLVRGVSNFVEFKFEVEFDVDDGDDDDDDDEGVKPVEGMPLIHPLRFGDGDSCCCCCCCCCLRRCAEGVLNVKPCVGKHRSSVTTAALNPPVCTSTFSTLNLR